MKHLFKGNPFDSTDVNDRLNKTAVVVEENVGPKPSNVAVHILNADYIPLGVCFLDKNDGRGGRVSHAHPIAVGVKVSWFVEPGILLVNGLVKAVGKSYEFQNKGGRPFVSDSESLDKTIEKALGVESKIKFTEFEDNLFVATRRAVALPVEVAARLRALLSLAFPDFSATLTEEDMDKAISGFRGAPSPKAEDDEDT